MGANAYFRMKNLGISDKHMNEGAYKLGKPVPVHALQASSCGASVVEMSIVIIVFLLLVGGIIDIALYLQNESYIKHSLIAGMRERANSRFVICPPDVSLPTRIAQEINAPGTVIAPASANPFARLQRLRSRFDPPNASWAATSPTTLIVWFDWNLQCFFCKIISKGVKKTIRVSTVVEGCP